MKVGLACILVALLFYVSAAAPAGTTGSAVILPSGNELRGSATDVMLVSVVSVDAKLQSKTGDPCVTDFDVKGRVISVNATSVDVVEGDLISFGSYDVDKEALGCLGYAVGPLPPLKLEPGWCGKVYLKSNQDGDLSIAAYGHSFVSAADPDDCKKALDGHVKALDVGGIDATGADLIDVDAYEDDEEDGDSDTNSVASVVHSIIPAISGTAMLSLLL
ncbi:expressed unknown protein [Seminavis robusta]|uniref:Uncharacterized protein n=1 Tax=Seminavis robusta TaxID=568900 RepID=A0A9N8E287_9STRA|nr:expressed unknown protein [Seminavis robusta]|eukprot:Sro579_g170020.1 n/a (218) ;mRNA; f:42388-43041